MPNRTSQTRAQILTPVTAVSAAASEAVSDEYGFNAATSEWWFKVLVHGKPVYEHDGYRGELAAKTDMARYRVMAEQFVQRALDAVEREKTRPYTVLVVAQHREIAANLIPYLRWRLDLSDADAEFIVGTYGFRVPSGTVCDGVVFVHPRQAESTDPGILTSSAECVRRGGWRAYIGGSQPWKNARDLLLPQ